MNISTMRDRSHTLNMIILMLCAPFLFIGGIVLTVVVLLNIFGGEPGYFGKFDAAATIYNDGEYAEFADEWLEAGVVLANDLNSADTPETTKQQIEARLEKLRGTINWTQLDPIEREDWFRIDSAIRLRHIQEAQIQDIANKRHCLAIVASSANPETGEFNFGQPEGTCP